MQLSKGSLNFLKIHIFIIFRVHKSIPSQQISWYTPSDLKTPQELCDYQTLVHCTTGVYSDRCSWFQASLWWWLDMWLQNELMHCTGGKRMVGRHCTWRQCLARSMWRRRCCGRAPTPCWGQSCSTWTRSTPSRWPGKWGQSTKYPQIYHLEIRFSW